MAFLSGFWTPTVVFGVQNAPVRIGMDVEGEPPVPIQRVELALPRGFPPMLAIFEVVVYRDGTVGDIQLLKASNPGQVQPFIDALKQWRFRPGRVDGKPVDACFTVTFRVPERSTHPEQHLVPRPERRIIEVPGIPPRPIVREESEYRPEWKEQGLQGVVILKVRVRKDGRVDQIRVLRSLYKVLSEAAKHAVREWRFVPARVEGRTVDAYFTVTFRFFSESERKN